MCIDIEAVVRSRMGKKARYVPNFVFAWLRRLIHEDFINAYLQQQRTGIDFCRGALDYLGVTIDVRGLENIPKGRPLTFVSNHPLGGIDGITLGAVIGENTDETVRFLVNDLLMNLEGLAPLCVPINKIGGQSRALPQLVDEAFAGENHVIMFPAGLCSRLIDGKVQDVEWAKAFVTKSYQHKRDVVPVHFIGQNSRRFYRVAKLCKTLHLPNFAMILLPDELYRSRGKSFEVRFGKPIPWQTFDRSKTPMKWAKIVRDGIYEI